MSFKIIKSYAKINLSLGVTGRLKSGYHAIESLVSFLSLYDEIKIRKIKNQDHKIHFVGKFSKGINKNNTVSNLLKILDENDLLNSHKYFIKIKKNIPQKSGLGGGSMNASSLIRFFRSQKILDFSKIKIENLTKQIGSDVKLGLDYKDKILYSNGKIKTLSTKKQLFVIVIKPNFGCSTKEVYKSVKKYSLKKIKNNKVDYFNFSNISKLQNDLEYVVFKKYPKLTQVKSFIDHLPNLLFARMSGSGSSILGYFLTKNSAVNAAKIFKKKYKSYWCITSKTI